MGRDYTRRFLLAAQLRVPLVLASGFEPRPLRPLLRTLVGPVEPVETALSGVPTTLYRPPRRDPPWPTLVLLPGITRRGRLHPAFVGVGRGLAAAGCQVAVVEPPGLAIGELTPRTLEATVAAALELLERPAVAGGRLLLAGVSGGGTLALVTAAGEELAERVAGVTALAPCCDIREALRSATTGCFERDGGLVPFRSGGFLRLVLARSALAWLPDGPSEAILRERLLAVADDDPDPLRVLRGWPREELGEEARALVALLVNEDARRFDELFAALGDAPRSAARALSPVHRAAGVRAPVELVVAREDKYLPLEDALSYARACPRARITVIDSLEHAVPSVSPGAAADLARLDRVLVRQLAALLVAAYSRR